jgi:uncharacterized protein YjbI with pentapeptide repeats
VERKEALELLRSGPAGVNKWNEWRESVGKGAPLPILSNGNFEGLNLLGVDLREVDLTSANLRGTVLRRAALDRANLTNAFLEDADLRGAHLDYAILRAADLRGVNLDGASMREADLSHADLKGAHLLRARLADARLIDADLRGAYMRSTYMRQARLNGAKLDGAHLRAAYLRGADLGGASLDGVYWREAILDEEVMIRLNLLPTLAAATLSPPEAIEEPSPGATMAFGRVRFEGPVSLARLAQVVEKIHHLGIAAFRCLETTRNSPQLDALARSRMNPHGRDDERWMVSHADLWQWLCTNDPIRAARHSRSVIVRQFGLTHDGGLELACDPRAPAGLAIALAWILVVDALRRTETSAFRLSEREKGACAQTMIETLRSQGLELAPSDAMGLIDEAVGMLRAIGVAHVSAPREGWIHDFLRQLRVGRQNVVENHAGIVLEKLSTRSAH